MEKQRNQNSLQFWGVLVLATVLISHHQFLVFPGVMCRTFEDQKNYYPSPDPHHGGGSPKSPSHGSNGKPPHERGGNCAPKTTTPSPPKHSGGGYSPTPTTVTPPTPAIVSPPTPVIVSPPVIISTPPSTPTDPEISSPPTPLVPDDPNLPPFIGTCDFWRTHPTVIWGLCGWWASLGSIFGGGGGVGVIPSSLETQLTLPQALSNTRTDGIGALYREGIASLLNSMVTKKFPYSTQQIKESFIKALASENTAATQAQLFKKANEGRFKHKA